MDLIKRYCKCLITCGVAIAAGIWCYSTMAGLSYLKDCGRPWTLSFVNSCKLLQLANKHTNFKWTVN